MYLKREQLVLEGYLALLDMLYIAGKRVCAHTTVAGLRVGCLAIKPTRRGRHSVTVLYGPDEADRNKTRKNRMCYEM